MSYAGQGSGTTQTPEERRAEATRILEILDGVDQSSLTYKAQSFIEQMQDNLLQPISTHQLWWLRDIKDRLL